MFSYYLQNRSYYFATDEEVKIHLDELNNIVVVSDNNDHFYRWENFEMQPYNRWRTIGQHFADGVPQYLAHRVLPSILRRIKCLPKPYLSLQDIDGDFKRTGNAFLGPSFSSPSIRLISNKTGYYDFRADFIKNNVSGANFKKCCDLALNQICITDDAAKTVKSLGNESRRIYEKLTELDRYLSLFWKGTFSEYDVVQKANLDISDESDTTKREPKLKAYRYFNIPGIGGRYCFLHIKTGNGMRYHIYPDEENKIVYVPYIGPHLPTKNNS